MIRFLVSHTTKYEYTESVAVAHHVARLTPRTLPGHECVQHELTVEPAAALTSGFLDYFGNTATFIAIHGAHRRLVIRARSTIVVDSPPIPLPHDTPPWEAAADRATMPFEAVEFAVNAEPQAPPGVDAYARRSFPPGRRLLEAVLELTGRIHREFTFDAKATTVATPLVDVLALRRGVCQDFARFAIACLRAVGLAARYVSGYIETVPAPGKPRLIGADASHAWLAVFCPGAGWIAVDPTNNLLPSDRHITVGWGRDYNDVSPVRGVILGGGAHALTVHVDVSRLS